MNASGQIDSTGPVIFLIALGVVIFIVTAGAAWRLAYNWKLNGVEIAWLVMSFFLCGPFGLF